MTQERKQICKQRSHILLKCVALLVAVAIWILSSQRTLPTIKGIFGIDKVQHMLAYAVLAVGMAFWFSRARWETRAVSTLALVVCIVSLYGATDEIHQHFVQGRSCDAWDWVADTIGAILGATSYLKVLKLK
jgi:VanZ family protein